MEGMMIHQGGEIVTKASLDLIPMPKETRTYKPVSHYQLTDRIQTLSQDILTDYVMVSEKYALAKEGKRFFAMLTFKKNGNTEMGMSVAYRNSYDNSMSVGIAIGASVFVCDNLSLSGDIAIMRKHTKNVWQTLEDLSITTFYRANRHFDKALMDAEKLKQIEFSDDKAFSLMGRLYGREIISPRQITIVRDQWLKPDHPEFEPRDKWSFFNAVTESLKSTPPNAIMQKHREAYDAVIDV